MIGPIFSISHIYPWGFIYTFLIGRPPQCGPLVITRLIYIYYIYIYNSVLHNEAKVELGITISLPCKLQRVRERDQEELMEKAVERQRVLLQHLSPTSSQSQDSASLFVTSLSSFFPISRFSTTFFFFFQLLQNLWWDNLILRTKYAVVFLIFELFFFWLNVL